MISLDKSLKQMAWADAKLFAVMQELPDEAWQTKVADGEWPVASNLFHLIASADWYAFELGQKIHFTGEPDSIEEIRGLGDRWRETNEFLISEGVREDGPVAYIENGKEFTVQRSTVLSQAVIHSVEHRIHIALALKRGGFDFPDLEDFSVWGYVHSLGSEHGSLT